MQKQCCTSHVQVSGPTQVPIGGGVGGLGVGGDGTGGVGPALHLQTLTLLGNMPGLKPNVVGLTFTEEQTWFPATMSECQNLFKPCHSSSGSSSGSSSESKEHCYAYTLATRQTTRYRQKCELKMHVREGYLGVCRWRSKYFQYC